MGMRIGIVVEVFDPRRGGAESWTCQHVRQLLDHGHEVHVFAGTAAPFLFHPRLHLHLFGRLRSRLARAEAAAAALRHVSLDVVHDIGAGWGGDVFQSEDGSRLAQWERLLQTLPPSLRPIKRALFHVLPRYADFRRLAETQFGDPHRLQIAVSRMCALDYQRFHQVPEDRIRIIYHGTDLERFTPALRRQYRRSLRAELAVSDQTVVFLFVGHDHVRKGLATAQRAVGRLAAQGAPVCLVVAGERQRSQPRSRPTPPAYVRFAGRVNDMPALYSAADVFVLPTFYDPCSLSVGEAAASGLPVVTTRCNGASELLTEGVEGFVLDDPADDVGLAQRLTELLDQELRDRQGAAARRLAEAYPSERNCAEILAVYAEVCAARKQRRIASDTSQRRAA